MYVTRPVGEEEDAEEEDKVVDEIGEEEDDKDVHGDEGGEE